MTQYILNDYKKSKQIVFALWIVYAASYFVRTCYASVIISIVDNGLFAKGEIGLIGTAFFICYGVGQLINGVIGDRVDPFALIATGIFLGGVSCFFMAFSRSLIPMIIIWGANGYFQSMLWSPILRIFSETIDSGLRKKSVLNISLSLPVGTIFAYLASTVIIKFFEWQAVFICGGLVSFAVFALIIAAIIHTKNDITKTHTDGHNKNIDSKSKASILSLGIISGMFIIIVPSFLHGMMRDGITNWVPTMITETYGVTPSFSLLLTIIIPIFNSFGAYAVTPLYKKLGENEMKTAGLVAIISIPIMVALLFIGKVPVYVSIVLLALTTSSMYALNYLIISLVPVHFSGLARTSTVSGILNSAAHIGCAVSSYGFGAISDKFGWSNVIKIWIASALLICIFSFLSNIKWKKFIK